MDKKVLNERMLGLAGVVPMSSMGFLRTRDLPSCDLTGIYKKETLYEVTKVGQKVISPIGKLYEVANIFEGFISLETNTYEKLHQQNPLPKGWKLE